jgi:hypothetical protein
LKRFPVSILNVRSTALTLVGVLGGTLALVSTGNAACGRPNTYGLHKNAWHATERGSPYLKTGYEVETDEEIVSDSPAEHRFSPYAIVGVWKYQITVNGGPMIDFGYQLWHSDGTEDMSSGARAPQTGYTCVGVWDRITLHHYKLNHFAWGWNATGTVFMGPVAINEDIETDPTGKHFSGTVEYISYKPDGVTVDGAITRATVTGDRVEVK